jgi:hypothetical protein
MAPVSDAFRRMGPCIVWRLGFRQSSFRHIARAPRRTVPRVWTRPPVFWHAVVPFTFRIQVSHSAQEPPFEFLPAMPGTQQGASRRTYIDHRSVDATPVVARFSRIGVSLRVGGGCGPGRRGRSPDAPTSSPRDATDPGGRRPVLDATRCLSASRALTATGPLAGTVRSRLTVDRWPSNRASPVLSTRSVPWRPSRPTPFQTTSPGSGHWRRNSTAGAAWRCTTGAGLCCSRASNGRSADTFRRSSPRCASWGWTRSSTASSSHGPTGTSTSPRSNSESIPARPALDGWRSRCAPAWWCSTCSPARAPTFVTAPTPSAAASWRSCWTAHCPPTWL